MRSISQDEFRRFLLATQRADRACTHCGNRFYTLNTDAADSVSAVSSLKVHVPEAGGYHEFLSAACLNCGRTDFFHTNQIEAWLSAHPIFGEGS